MAGAAAATVGAATMGVPELAGASGTDPTDRIRRLFTQLPGTNAIKIFAPATRETRRLQVSVKASERLFIGSAFKTFVARRGLRQAEPDVLPTITGRQLALDASVWMTDSATFNPPNLTGTVSERTALEAMILHSDNTGTDMSLKQVGPDNVRALIASAGLTNTLIPDSTRSFAGYLLGAPDYLTFTWDQLVAAADDPFVNPALNTTQTLASSADDLVSWHSRALQGEFFSGEAALNEYRAILSIGDVIWLSAVPTRRECVCQGRQHRHARLPCRVCRRGHVLRRRLGVLLFHHQLGRRRRVRPGHGRGLGRRRQRSAAVGQRRTRLTPSRRARGRARSVHSRASSSGRASRPDRSLSVHRLITSTMTSAADFVPRVADSGLATSWPIPRGDVTTGGAHIDAPNADAHDNREHADRHVRVLSALTPFATDRR